MIYFDIFEKNCCTFIRIDITDIFSKKNKSYYKFELIHKDKTVQKICDYSISEIEENDEYSFFVLFDITGIDFKQVNQALLIQYQKHRFSKRETVYHTFRI